MKMLSSKKILVAFLGVLLLLIRQHTDWLAGWSIEDIVKPIGAYLFAQGLEDWGKSEAQIRIDNPEAAISDIVRTIKELFGQRKTGLMLAQLVIGFGNQLMPGLIDDQTATWAINLLMGSTVAIGIADVKKSAAKIANNSNGSGKTAEQKMMEALG